MPTSLKVLNPGNPATAQRKCLINVHLLIIIVLFLVLEVGKTLPHQAMKRVTMMQRQRALLGCHQRCFRGDFLAFKSLRDAAS